LPSLWCLRLARPVRPCRGRTGMRWSRPCQAALTICVGRLFSRAQAREIEPRGNVGVPRCRSRTHHKLPVHDLAHDVLGQRDDIGVGSWAPRRQRHSRRLARRASSARRRRRLT
jgi:hypothetical protein